MNWLPAFTYTIVFVTKTTKLHRSSVITMKVNKIPHSFPELGENIKSFKRNYCVLFVLKTQ